MIGRKPVAGLAFCIILSAGGYSLITAEKDTELGQLCKKFPGIAKRVEPEDLQAFITGLITLIEHVNNAESHNAIARQYALDYLNKDAVLGRFEADLLALAKTSEPQIA